MRVLHVIESLGRGGAERVVVTLARAQAAEDAVAVASLTPPSHLAVELERAGIEVFELGLRDRRDSIRALLGLSRVVARFRPDVIHTHLLFSELYVGLLPRPKETAAVATFHNMGFEAFSSMGLKQRAVRSLERAALVNRFDGLVAVSERAAESYRAGLRLPDVSVVLNPLDVAAVRGPATSRAEVRARLGIVGAAPLLVLVGKLTDAKGIDVALRALREPGLERARLAVVGAGPLRAQLEALSGELGVASRVLWPGEVDAASVPAWLQAADVVVMPSRSEGLPITLLEAMAVGAPLVATRVGGIPEALTDGETGILVPPEDPAALAGAVRGLLERPELAQRLGAAATTAVESRFGVKGIVERYRSVYENAMTRRRRR